MILNALRVALRIFSGKIIFISRLSRPAGRSKRIFTSGVAKGNSICSLKALFYHYGPSREKVFQPIPRLRSNESPSGAFKRQSGLR